MNEIQWYLPTFFGDIRLTSQGSGTSVEWENLTPTEKAALEKLSAKYSLPMGQEIPPSGEASVSAPIEKVENVIARAMKRGRKLLTAVTFSGGKIEEVHRGDGETKGMLAKAAKAAVTVAQPTVGCPSPEFEKAEIRATRVLRNFLNATQLADFEHDQRFIVTGADSGHRYMLISRHSPRLSEFGGRSVYDVTEGRPVCVHDWLVPASEELLELVLFLSLRGREQYVRSLPEAFS
jgi:hypothetical protein